MFPVCLVGGGSFDGRTFDQAALAGTAVSNAEEDFLGGVVAAVVDCGRVDGVGGCGEGQALDQGGEGTNGDDELLRMI